MKIFLKQVQKRILSNRGFNLIEVAVSIGIVGFGLVALLGLMTVALNTTKDTSDDHQIAIIARQLMGDRLGTPYQVATPSGIPALDTVPVGGSTTLLYLTKEGAPCAPPAVYSDPAYYRAVVDLVPMAPAAATHVRISVEWPVFPANSTITNRTIYTTIIPHTTL